MLAWTNEQQDNGMHWRNKRRRQWHPTPVLLPEKSHGWTQLSPTLRPHGLYSPWKSPGQNTGVGRLTLLQWIFSTKELNWGLLHCRRILYQLSYKGSPDDRMNTVYCFMKIKTMAS